MIKVVREIDNVNKKLILVQFSRALVPVMVMFFHLSLTMMEYYQFNLLGFSFIPMSGGVNYFFVLSGFMMYYIYRKKFGQTGQMKNSYLIGLYEFIHSIGS